MKKVYLAIPFTGIEELSFQSANEISAILIGEGYNVFSPISHSYPIWKTNLVEHTYDVWLNQDKAFVEWADELIVTVIKGFEDRTLASKGVQQEVDWAFERDIPIIYINYDPETKAIKTYE